MATFLLAQSQSAVLSTQLNLLQLSRIFTTLRPTLLPPSALQAHVFRQELPIISHASYMSHQGTGINRKIPS